MVTIAAAGVAPATVELGQTLKAAAKQWAWVVRNRARWASQTDSSAEQSQRSRQQLRSFGLADNQLDALGAADIIQVSVPFSLETEGWEARVFPWEYVLGSANRDLLAKRPLVVRRLVVEGHKDGASSHSPPSPALIVVSAPGVLRQKFEFDDELDLIKSNLADVEVRSSKYESDMALREQVAKTKPKAIHLAGVDGHQGSSLLGIPQPEHDGYLMEDARGAPRLVDSEALAAILTAGGKGLRLVACNFWNSASRIAAMAVATGSEAAIGFQDQVDDSIAELFYATFYGNWANADWRVGPAFETTMRELRGRGALRGTGVVLWSRRDLLAEHVAAPSPTPAAREARKPTRGTSGRRVKSQPMPAVADDAVTVEARPFSRINYSLLHNDQGLFETFRIRKQVPDVVRRVHLEVVLYVGGDSYPYRTSLELTEPVTDIRERIRVPLTSSVLRSFHESVRSVVYVEVRVDDRPIFQDTWRVTIVPADEWMDDDSGGIWLPSFVLPRDPAVSTVVDAAYPLIRTLRDTGDRAFDGYQAIDSTASGDARYKVLDAQVQALWSALTFQFGLRYINPPPTYSPQAQRLRTPSEVLRTRAGTCIDLALLFASCLEYVDIYPVLFLLPGHCLPGYWRDEALHSEFRRVGVAGAPDGTDPTGQLAATSAGQQAAQSPWLLRTGSDWTGPVYAELDGRIRSGDVVPMETVALTKETAFRPAIGQAKETLSMQIESMVDVKIARLSGITPLPLDAS